MKKHITLIMALIIVVACFADNVFAKKIVVATDTNFKPFSFKASTGEYTGFDVEMWAALAKRIGLDYQLQPMDFNGIIPGLQSGTIDVAISPQQATIGQTDRRHAAAARNVESAVRDLR